MMHALRHPIQFRRDHRFTVDHASDYLDGQLPPSSTERVEHHASLCPKCRELLSSLRSTLTGLRALRAPDQTTPTPSVTAGILDALRAEDGDGDNPRSHDP